MNTTLKFAGIAGLALTLFTAGVSARTIEKSFNVGSGGQLTLETDGGSIEIDSHSGNEVKVSVELRGSDADKMDVRFDSSGNDVTIKGKRERSGGGGFWGRTDLRVAYHVTVPVNYNLDVDTAGGSISIEDLTGQVKAHTSGGSISLGHIDGVVDVDTSGGSISVDEVTGTINAHTSGGSVSARISKQPEGDCKLTTSGGSITVELAQNIAVDLNAHTSGGRVRSDFDVDGSVSKKSIRGRINGGGPKLVLKTSGGSVRVGKM